MGENNCRKGLSRAMPKEKIHPNYAAVQVKCACGNSFETRSTHKGDIHVEICSVCHPFFTGKQRLVDTAGRVERFRRKYAKSDGHRQRQQPPSNRARQPAERLGLRQGGASLCCSKRGIPDTNRTSSTTCLLNERLDPSMPRAKRSIQFAITLDGHSLIWRLHREQQWFTEDGGRALRFMSRSRIKCAGSLLWSIRPSYRRNSAT